ncbi:hypothetical protein TRVA0_019S00892 [Trichomonascus vanleenenianus]|uniref:uncharacterized protein n=1 Tax=Trichomonascus vanleenenianus TaxID=2268995 RepID=UPI003EC97A5F
MAAPPATDAVLAATEDALLAFYGDPCDSMQVARYNSSSNKWAILDTDNSPGLRSASVWALPQQSDIVYLYGGATCDGSVSNQLIEFNTTAGSFTPQQNAISPAGLEGASAVILSNSSAVLVGGKSSEAWIGMTQLAQWQADSWTFRGVANSSGIDSRTGALAVSVFPGRPFQDSTSNVVVVGGTVAGRSATPHIVRLILDDGVDAGWAWCNDTKLDLGSDALGLFGIFNTVAVVSSSNLKGKRSSSGGYSIDLYDVNSGDKIDTFPNPLIHQPDNNGASVGLETLTRGGTTLVQTITKDRSTKSQSTKRQSSTNAAVSTSTKTTASPTTSTSATGSPQKMSKGGVAALSTVLPVTAVAIFSAIFMIYRRKKKQEEQERVSITENPFADNPFAPNDAASIDSWNEKRQWLKLHASSSNDTNASARAPKVGFPGPPVNPTSSVARRRVSSQPTQRIKRLFSNSYDSSGDENPEKEEEDTISDQEEFFRNRDVQILVSSQRRSRLVVTNPDTNSDTESDK